MRETPSSRRDGAHPTHASNPSLHGAAVYLREKNPTDELSANNNP
jgi:hypothetical protein